MDFLYHLLYNCYKGDDSMVKDNKAQVSFRVPQKLFDDFKSACDKMGLTYSSVLTACMIATLRKKQIPFEIGFDDDSIISNSKYTYIDSNINTSDNAMFTTDSTNNANNNTSNDSGKPTSDSNSNKKNTNDLNFFADFWGENKDK